MSEPFSHNWSNEVPADLYSVGLKFNDSFHVNYKGQLTTDKLN